MGDSSDLHIKLFWHTLYCRHDLRDHVMLLLYYVLVPCLALNYVVPNVHLIGSLQNSWVYEVAKVLNCKVGVFSFMYLGLAVIENLRRANTWGPDIDKLKSKLSSWRSRNLFMDVWSVLMRSFCCVLQITIVIELLCFSLIMDQELNICF